MSKTIDQYPQDAYFLVANGSSTELGSYVTNGGDLRLAHMRVYHKRTGSFSYTMRIVISSKEGGPELATSSTETFSDTAIGQTTSDWLGDLSFDMPYYNLLSGERYYARLEMTGYTRDFNTTYLGVWCDWLEPIGTSNTAGARLAMGVMR